MVTTVVKDPDVYVVHLLLLLAAALGEDRQAIVATLALATSLVIAVKAGRATAAALDAHLSVVAITRGVCSTALEQVAAIATFTSLASGGATSILS
jgi:hypothetical protein